MDLPDLGSNQHELNGVFALQKFFGTTERVKGEMNWQYYIDGETPHYDRGDFTFYDARENNPDRTEWRLYYTGDFLTRASPGDILVLTRDVHDRVNGLVFQRHSGWLRAAVKFFGLSIDHPGLRIVNEDELKSRELDISQRWIAEELQFELSLESSVTDDELVKDEFGYEFPTTANMSKFAREHSEDYVTSPDQTLLSWLEREEQLFLALEKMVVDPRLRQGFTDVDEFVQYSLSVQNRRKSRMGLAFQNQLQALFDLLEISYSAQAKTEGNNKPDFIFPGIDKYQDTTFDSALLTMLGVKSSCKDRWRQILTEAERIQLKHLCTLDQAISLAQGEEMVSQNVILVIPEPLRESYRDFKHPVINVDDFVGLVKDRQRHAES